MSESEPELINEPDAATNEEQNPKEVKKEFYQHEINAMIKGAKNHAAKKTREEVMEELQQQGLLKEPGAPQQQPATMGGMLQVSPEQLRALVSEETQKHHKTTTDEIFQKLRTEADNQRATQTVSNFLAKVEAGKKFYPDFDEKLAKLGNLGQYAPIIQHMSEMENPADMLYDLAENFHKVPQLMMSNAFSEKATKDELMKLSISSKANREAKQLQFPDSPLDQLKPSMNSGGSSNANSVAYFKSKYKG